MKIDFNLSEQSIAKAKKIEQLRNQKPPVTWDRIAPIIGNHRTYVIALHKFYQAKKEANGEK